MSEFENDLAFPGYVAEHHQNGDGLAYLIAEGGLTKRELFAAITLRGEANYQGGPEKPTAEHAVRLADALIIALNANKLENTSLGAK